MKTIILLSILAAVAQMAHAANATGGTITTNSGNRIHTFTNSGTFAVTEAGNMSLLIVAGGGAGGPLNGSPYGGGGGAGGLIYNPAFFVSTGTISVVVGAGGVSQGLSGGNSSFGPTYWTNALGVTLTNAVGGGGGGSNGGNGLAGGSGGGGGQGATHIGGAGTLGQGYAGGTNYGGGGGAGALGGTGSGAGGNGRQLSISCTAQWYAGGGGGAGGGHGGLGGGGSSLVVGNGTAGTNGLGGGGGAGWSGLGGVGGSGIVIVSYPLDILNLPPSNIVSDAAFLNGLIPGGANFTTVSVYWGPTDGGTNAALWANTNVFSGGPWNVGGVLTTNIALAPSQDYFYTYYASNNAAGGAMAANPSQYFMDGALTLAATDASLGTSPTDTATVVVSRPSNCTNGPLTVYYTLGGTATNGVNYSASPASGALVIPAGQTNASITLTPLQLSFGVAGSITVNLASGAYVIGSPSTANCSLQKWPVMATPATGGIITTNVTAYGSYRVHTFTNSGVFTATSPGNVLVLVVAGGGGGGGRPRWDFGSGGGAGGLIYTNTFISAGTNTVTIGAGGAGCYFDASPFLGSNGSATVFGSLTAIGGGGGSGGNNAPGNGNAGGSGGGGWYAGGVGGSGLQPSSASGGYGNSGGYGPSGAGGGGGGAGAAAVNGNGNGADGLPFSICGTGTVYYAGGGSGAGSSYASKGGGGQSIAGTNSASGVANSGGGGGGAWDNGGYGWAGNGGSGIVIVSYPIAHPSSMAIFFR